MADGIPRWVWDRVAEIDNRHVNPEGNHEWARYADELRCALAEHIAAHEEPPALDPLLIEARQCALTALEGELPATFVNRIEAGNGDDGEFVRIALSALKRGIELGKERRDG